MCGEGKGGREGRRGKAKKGKFPRLLVITFLQEVGEKLKALVTEIKTNKEMICASHLGPGSWGPAGGSASFLFDL